MARPSRLVVILVLSLVGARGVTAQSDRSLRGRPVQSVIDELRAAGAPFVYSSNLLPSSLTVVAEPRAPIRSRSRAKSWSRMGSSCVRRTAYGSSFAGETPAVAEPGGVRLRVQAAYAGTRRRLTVQLDPPSGPTTSGS